jgi:hypothetical protein
MSTGQDMELALGRTPLQTIADHFDDERTAGVV